jgi:hypothetical protein
MYANGYIVIDSEGNIWFDENKEGEKIPFANKEDAEAEAENMAMQDDCSMPAVVSCRKHFARYEVLAERLRGVLQVVKDDATSDTDPITPEQVWHQVVGYVGDFLAADDAAVDSRSFARKSAGLPLD